MLDGLATLAHGVRVLIATLLHGLQPWARVQAGM
jgi:hypothetical protein